MNMTISQETVPHGDYLAYTVPAKTLSLAIHCGGLNNTLHVMQVHDQTEVLGWQISFGDVEEISGRTLAGTVLTFYAPPGTDVKLEFRAVLGLGA